MKIGVLGGGAWGTALAQVAVRAGHDAVLWAREPEVVAGVGADHENRLFLPGVSLDMAVRATSEVADLAASDVVLATVPAQHLRGVLQHCVQHFRAGTPVVLCAKGIEQGSLKLMTEVLAETLAEALAGKLSVAEGVSSAPAVRGLAARLGVETPIGDAVAAILAGETDIDAAIAGLLARPLKSES